MVNLIKMEIDRDTAARHRLYDSYQWHKAIWKLFPNRPDDSRQFLLRIDQTYAGFRIYVLSRYEPVRPEWCPEESWIGVKTIKPTFLNHSDYRFDLKANPTRKIRKVGKDGNFTKNGKRVAITKLSDQIDWFHRKAETAGFIISPSPELMIEPAINNAFHKSNRSELHAGLHVGVRFQGILKVVNKEFFQKAFYEGIGSAKGFGFGMLLLKPLVLSKSSFGGME